MYRGDNKNSAIQYNSHTYTLIWCVYILTIAWCQLTMYSKQRCRVDRCVYKYPTELDPLETTYIPYKRNGKQFKWLV